MHQFEMVSLEDLVRMNHSYKKFASIWTFEYASKALRKIEKANPVTPANTPDAKGLKNVCPDSRAVYTDKAYCVMDAEKEARKRGCYLRAIKKNNMKGKDKEQDRWFSHLRSPDERVFSKEDKRVRYRGVVKNQFAAYMQAICFNLKRLLVLEPPHLQLT